MSDTPTDPPADAADAGARAEAEEAAPPPDPEREALADALRADLGDGFVEHVNARGDLVVRVAASSWRTAGETLRTKHGFDYFCFLSGIDWLRSPEQETRHEQVWTAETPAAPETPLLGDRVGGGETRYQVFARVYSTTRKLGITLKADLDDAAPSVESWVHVYRGADWHERECWEMFGFDFVGHPGLRHMYLPMEFEGFPLRKDFPLLSRIVKPWPGLVDKEPIPGEDEDEPAEEGASA